MEVEMREPDMSLEDAGMLLCLLYTSDAADE